MMNLSPEALATVAKGMDWHDASYAQFRRAIEMVRSGKARLVDAGLTVEVDSQSTQGKCYRFPVECNCSCIQAVEHRRICVHRICADLLVVQDRLDIEAQAAEHDAGTLDYTDLYDCCNIY